MRPMMCRMSTITTTYTTCPDCGVDGEQYIQAQADGLCADCSFESYYGPRSWSNDPDRTTRQFVASVPPGGQR
jgi:hypothetical protein